MLISCYFVSLLPWKHSSVVATLSSLTTDVGLRLSRVRRPSGLAELVQGRGRREHYRVVQQPLDFVTQLWDESQSG